MSESPRQDDGNSVQTKTAHADSIIQNETKIQYIPTVPERERHDVRSQDLNASSKSIDAFDETEAYKISLPEFSTSNIAPQSSYVLYGTVNGSAFKLKIPKTMLQKSHDIVTLQVETVATGDVVSTQIGFVDMLKDLSRKHRVDLYTDDIDNYVYSQDEALKLPGQ